MSAMDYHMTTANADKGKPSLSLDDMLDMVERMMPPRPPIVARINMHPSEFDALLSSVPRVVADMGATLGSVALVSDDECFPHAAKCFDGRGRFLHTMDLMKSAHPARTDGGMP
jgi:hypothetical protein